MSISRALKGLFSSKKDVQLLAAQVSQSQVSPKPRAPLKGSKPTVQPKSPREAVHVPVAVAEAGASQVTRPVRVKPRPPIARTKSIKAFFARQVREIEARIPVDAPNLPLDKVGSEGQKRKLRQQFANLPAEERDELGEFIEVVKEDDDEALPGQLAESFRGRLSLQLAFGKFARPFAEDLWTKAGVNCPWPASVRLDVQLLLMNALEVEQFMQHLMTDLESAKQAFSDPSVKTLKQGLELFELNKLKASCLSSSPKSDSSAVLDSLAEPQAVPTAEVELQLQSGVESCPLPGFVETDRPAELSLRALRELASCGDRHKVLCAGPTDDGKTVFGPRQEWSTPEAKKCAEYLMWHPLVGRHLVDYSKGNVVTVRGLQLALKQLDADD